MQDSIGERIAVALEQLVANDNERMEHGRKQMADMEARARAYEVERSMASQVDQLDNPLAMFGIDDPTIVGKMLRKLTGEIDPNERLVD